MRIKIVILLLHTFWRLILADETSEINSDEFIAKMLNLELLKKETAEDFSYETAKDFEDLIEEVLGPTENSKEYLFRIESPSQDQESSSTIIGKSFPIITGVVNRDEDFKPPIFIYEDVEDSDNRKKHVDSSHKVSYPEYSFRTRYGIPLIGGFNYALGGSGELFKSDVRKPIGNSGWRPSIPPTSLYFIKSEDNNNDDSYSSYVPADQFNLNNKGTSSIDTIKNRGSNFFTPHINNKPFPTPPQRNFQNNVHNQPLQPNYESSYSSLNNNENGLKGTIGSGNHFNSANNYQGNIQNSPHRPGVVYNNSNRNEIDRKNDFQNTAVQKYYVQHDQNIRTNRPRIKAHYDFGYTVSSQGTSHGHQESRRGNRVEGVYHVDLPNGYRQVHRSLGKQEKSSTLFKPNSN